MQETGYDPCDNPNGQKMALKQRRQPSSSRENFQGWKSIQTEVEQISCMQAHELVPGSGQRPCPVSSRGLVCGNRENQNFKIFFIFVEGPSLHRTGKRGTKSQNRKKRLENSQKKQTSSWAYKKSFSKPQIHPVRVGIARAWTLVLG